MNSTTDVHVFSNGDEMRHWTRRNCRTCPASVENNGQPDDEMPNCEFEKAIMLGEFTIGQHNVITGGAVGGDGTKWQCSAKRAAIAKKERNKIAVRNFWVGGR